MMNRRPYRKQEPPFNLALELTKGCSTACSFCAMAAIQDRPGRGYKFMEKSTLECVMKEVAKLDWNCRIGFAMRGEPSEHPECVEMIKIVRYYRPNAYLLMLSNGSGFIRKPGPVQRIQDIFEAGLNTLGLDHYQGLNWVPKILDTLGQPQTGQKHDLGFDYYEYPEDKRGNPHLRRKRYLRTLVRIHDIELESAGKKRGNHNKLSNFSGLAFPLNDSGVGKRCHQPFRQMVVHWDGNVPICCGTWDSPYNCGNVLNEGVEACWQSNAMGAAREMLFRGRREFKPCLGCDSRSFRVGLLPDLKGKGKLHKPDEQTAADIEATLALGIRDRVIRVPWKDKSHADEAT
jgi:MoaA/NifB/PqqE/SkfB family radical SAM enzyme